MLLPIVRFSQIISLFEYFSSLPMSLCLRNNWTDCYPVFDKAPISLDYLLLQLHMSPLLDMSCLPIRERPCEKRLARTWRTHHLLTHPPNDRGGWQFRKLGYSIFLRLSPSHHRLSTTILIVDVGALRKDFIICTTAGVGRESWPLKNALRPCHNWRHHIYPSTSRLATH